MVGLGRGYLEVVKVGEMVSGVELEYKYVINSRCSPTVGVRPEQQHKEGEDSRTPVQPNQEGELVWQWVLYVFKSEKNRKYSQFIASLFFMCTQYVITFI